MRTGAARAHLAALLHEHLAGRRTRYDDAGSVEVDAWRRLSGAEKAAVEAEASTLPLPNLTRAVTVRWTGSD